MEEPFSDGKRLFSYVGGESGPCNRLVRCAAFAYEAREPADCGSSDFSLTGKLLS